MKNQKNEVSDKELQTVIADFLEMGHVENIISMFRHEPDYFRWTGIFLSDERINVRLGLAILFEEFRAIAPDMMTLAIPSLADLLHSPEPLYRGEAISLLGFIGNEESLALIKEHAEDPSPQVREMVAMVLEEQA